MSITTAPTQTLQNRRPNSTHLESLLVTDFYGLNSDNGQFTTTNSSPSPTNSHKNYYDESAISHKRERSLPISNYSTSFSASETCDDALIYANLDEIQRKKEADLIDRAPRPPIPSEDDQPIRILRNSGWREYKTIGGRSYFFNFDLGVSQWMPPRSAKRNSVKESVMIEPTRKSSFCEALQNNSYSSFRLEKQNSKCSDQASSLSTDSTSTESLKYAEPPLVVTTHVTNPLIERELSLSKGPPRIEAFEKSTSFRGGPTSNGNQMAYRKLAADDTRVLSKFPGPSNLCTTTTFPVSTIDMSSSMSSATSSMRSRNFFTPSSAIHQGTLEKCRLLDGRTKVKKNEWAPVYAFLYSGHLLFYRDQKSAEKNGKHYPAPLDVCDLRGAKLCHADIEKFKDKRHKAIISLQLPNNIMYLFSTVDNEANIQDWFRALKDAILSLPQCPEFLPPFEHGSLGRPTNKIVHFNSKQSLRHSIKNGSKSANNKSKVDCEIPNKDSIIDRLLRFLRSRPTMEHLSERGIYKLEPVFGSNLSAICEHDRLPIPRFVTEVTAIIEKRGLKIDGLYRVSGNLSSIQKLRCQIDQDKYDALNKEEDVHVLTGLLKLFFRELSDPIIPYELNKEFLAGINEPRNRFKIYDELLKRLPEVNRRTLALLIGHLRRVAQHSSENRMQIHNLAIVFGPALFHSECRPATKTHQRRNSGFLSKKQQQPTVEQKTMPSQNLAYKMVVFGQITEFILNEAEKFQIFAGMTI